LKTIFKHLTEEAYLNYLFGKSKSIKEWDIQRYFIRRIDELVHLVQPKIIVCIGTKAFNDFTFTPHKSKESKVFKMGKEGYPVIGFTRSGNWSVLIPEIAKEIVAVMKSGNAETNTLSKSERNLTS
jgi:hypothetical protein